MADEIDSMFKHHRTKNSNHLVLLAHDQAYAKSDDSLQLREFLRILKQKGEYELSIISDYPGIYKSSQDTASAN